MNAFLTHFANEVSLIAPFGLERLAHPDPKRVELALAYARELGRAHGTQDKAAESDFKKYIRGMLEPKATVTDDGIAIVPVEGPLAYAPDPWDMLFYGVEDSRSVEKLIRSAAGNPDVRGVMLKIHSPGGTVMGGSEMADAVSIASSRKPTMAHSGGYMASLAYWVGSQARAGVVATASAYVGSIGVISTVTDVTQYLEKLGVKVEVFTNREAKFKALGAQGTSLTKEGRDHLQERTDALFAKFRDGVRTARPNVPDASMQGQVFVGTDAKKAGLVDGIGSLEYAMAELRKQMRSGHGAP